MITSTDKVISLLGQLTDELNQKSPLDILNVSYSYSNQAPDFEKAWRSLASKVGQRQPAPVKATDSSEDVNLPRYDVTKFDWGSASTVGALGFWFGSTLGQAYKDAPVTFDGTNTSVQKDHLLESLAHWSWAQVTKYLEDEHLHPPELDVVNAHNGTVEVPMSIRERDNLAAEQNATRD
jgi:hypothetical protein